MTEEVTAIPDSEASHKQAERKKGRRLLLTIPLGVGCEAREVFTRCPSFVQKAKESTEPKPKTAGLLPGIPIFSPSHPALCEQWGSSALEAWNAGNEPPMLMGIFPVKHASLSPHTIAH